MRTLPVVLLLAGLLAGCGSKDYTDEQSSWARQQCTVAGISHDGSGWDDCVSRFEKKAKQLQDAGLELK